MHVILDVNNEVKGIKGVEEEDAAVVEVEVVDSLAVGVLEENRHRDIFLSKFLVV